MSSTPELCQNCGATLPPDSRFCDSCGAPVPKQQGALPPAPDQPTYAAPQASYQEPAQASYQQPPQQPSYQQPYMPPTPPQSNRKTLYIILAVVAVLLLLGCGCCLVLYLTGQANNGSYDYSFGSQALPEAWAIGKSLFV